MEPHSYINRSLVACLFQFGNVANGNKLKVALKIWDDNFSFSLVLYYLTFDVGCYLKKKIYIRLFQHVFLHKNFEI
jgi:hypothetical protein